MSFRVKPKRTKTFFEALWARLLCGAATSVDGSASGFDSPDVVGAGAVAGAEDVGAALLRRLGAAARRPSGSSGDGP